MCELFPLGRRCSDDGRGKIVATYFGDVSVRVEGLVFAKLRAFVFLRLLLALMTGWIDSVNIA